MGVGGVACDSAARTFQLAVADVCPGLCVLLYLTNRASPQSHHQARQQPGISAAPAGAMPSNGTIQPSPLPAAALSRSRASSTPAPKPAVSTPKSRGKYRCKKCGQLKKGHVCPMDQLPAAVGKVRMRTVESPRELCGYNGRP